MNLLVIVPIILRSLAGTFLHPISRIITKFKTFKEAWNADIMLEIHENINEIVGNVLEALNIKAFSHFSQF